MQGSATHYKQTYSVVSCKQIIGAYGVHTANMWFKDNGIGYIVSALVDILYDGFFIVIT